MRRASDSLRLVRSAVDSLMRGRKARITIAAAAVSGLTILLVAALLFSFGPSTDRAQATGPAAPVFGFDMDPDDNGTGDVVAPNGVNKSNTVGTIQPCIAVPNTTGTLFDIDVFFDAIPLDANGDTVTTAADSLDIFNYALGFPDTVVSVDSQIVASTTALPAEVMMGIGHGDSSSTPPVTSSPDNISNGFTVGAGGDALAGTAGTLSRHRIKVNSAALSGNYTFSLSLETFLTDDLTDFTGSITDKLDGTHVPPYGMLALGVPCVGTTTPAPTPTPTPTLTSTPTTSVTPTPVPTPTPTGTGQTPSPTATGETPTATPTTTPTPTPVTTTPQPELMQGNVDCNGDVDSVDSLKELRYVALLSVQQNEPCPDIGTEVASLFGDVDCDGEVTSVDALKVLRHVAQLSVTQLEPCPDIGDPLS